MKIHSLFSYIVTISLFHAVNISASFFQDVDVSANDSLPKKEIDSPISPYKKELNSVVYGELEYLLWFSNPDGLHSPTVATGKSPNLSSKWSSGMRVAIGGQPSHWDTQLCYIYYSTNSQDKSNANIETILNSSPGTAGIFEVSEKWALHFNRLNWELGRKILFDHCFLLEPFFGLEGLEISKIRS